MKGAYKQERYQLFTQPDSDRLRGFKPEEERFRLYVRTFYSEDNEAHAQTAQTSWTFKARLKWGPGQPDLVSGNHSAEGIWNGMGFKVPSRLSHSTIL